MRISETFLPEVEQEMAQTRKTLARVPDDKFSYKPHEKSMTMGQLPADHRGAASHLAGPLSVLVRLLVLPPLDRVRGFLARKIDIGDHNLRAVLGKHERGGATNSAARAGYQGHFAFEIKRAVHCRSH